MLNALGFFITHTAFIGETTAKKTDMKHIFVCMQGTHPHNIYI